MSRKSVFIIAAVVILAVIGAVYFVQDRFVEKSAVQEASQQAVFKEREQWQQRTKKLENRVHQLEQQIQLEQTVDDALLAEAFGDPGEDAVLKETASVMNFFTYIDGKGYLPARGINETAYDHFQKIVERLGQSRPVISGETQDLFTLMKNITYFFRVLGKDSVLVIKDIIEGESALMEPVMKLFFEWMAPRSQSDESGRITLPIDVFYEYAGFFLNTMAGQAYLFRRDSTVRILTAYYCVVLLDRAHKEGINTYGIDIRSHVDGVIEDLQSYRQIEKRIEYLKTLDTIKNRYGS